MSSARAHPVAVFMIVVALAAVAYLPRGEMGDDVVRYQDMSRLLAGCPTEEKFSMVGPLCGTPLYLMGTFLSEGDGDIEIRSQGEVRIRHTLTVKRWLWFFNRVVTVIFCAVFWWLFRPVLSPNERARFIVALILVSMMTHHLMFFGGEIFTCATVGLGLAAIVLRRAWWGLPLVIMGTVNLPGTLGGLGVVSLVLVARTRRLRFCLAPPIAVGLWLLENYLRRGDALYSGYNGEHGTTTVLPYSGKWEFSYPLFFGLLSVLFSFGKGLIYFMPALFLPLPPDPERPVEDEDRLRWVYRVWMGYMVGVILMYSKWWCWSGGWFWGPRFFLFGCFIAALVIARRTGTASAERASTGANLLTLVALVLSAWVAVCGQVYKQDGLTRYVPDGNALEFLVWYVPECSALWWPFVTPVPFKEKDWIWFAFVGTALCYLAAPVVRVLALRAPEYAVAAWRVIRAAPVRI